jgi:hypothetical protein
MQHDAGKPTPNIPTPKVGEYFLATQCRQTNDGRRFAYHTDAKSS